MKLLLAALTTFFLTTGHAQPGYDIHIKVQGLADTTAYLGGYFKERLLAMDTARVNNKGEFSFRGAALPEGLYSVLVNQTRLFEFVLGKNQKFSMSTSFDDPVGTMRIKGDHDNTIFFENVNWLAKRQKELESVLKILRDSTLAEAEKQTAKAAYEKAGQDAMRYQNSLIEKYPSSTTARLLRMNQPVEVPEAPKDANGRVDSTFRLRYYQQHYFDNFDLGDELTLRVPKVVYKNKVDSYLDNLVVQHPDSISNAIYRLAAIARKSKETYKYLVWNCITTYVQHPIMGMDEVYVNLVDRYIATGEMDYWLDKKTISNVQDQANRMRRGMIGRVGADLVMQDANLQKRSLYEVESKYTVLYFFKPTCHTCIEETPKLVDLYNANGKRLGFEVFAVSTDTSMRDMKKFIKDLNVPWTTVNGPRSFLSKHFSQLYWADSTPTLYILDRQKKIIARKIGVEQIEDFLTNYDRWHDTPASR